MDSAIEVKIVYEEGEIKKAISCYILRVCGLRTHAMVACAIIIAVILFSLVIIQNALPAAVFAVLGLALYYIYYQRPLESYLRYYRKRSGGTYLFAVDSVSAAGEEVQSRFQWSVFKRAYEIPTAFLLTDDNKFVCVFPKACFDSELQVEQLRGLLADRFTDFKEYK